jgi:hypothetical protein
MRAATVLIAKFKFKTVLQNLPNIACRLTCCHVPFKGFFSLEKHCPFRQLVRMGTRRDPTKNALIKTVRTSGAGSWEIAKDQPQTVGRCPLKRESFMTSYDFEKYTG